MLLVVMRSMVGCTTRVMVQGGRAERRWGSEERYREQYAAVSRGKIEHRDLLAGMGTYPAGVGLPMTLLKPIYGLLVHPWTRAFNFKAREFSESTLGRSLQAEPCPHGT
jgi:hypothetical protein